MVLSIPAIAAAWAAGGGPASSRYNAVAVALAESGGDPGAQGYNSDSVDCGLWQINSVHQSFFGAKWANRFDPVTNAEMAVSVSSGGVNWGPWATAYTNINAEGWSAWLSYLEPGSPAAGHLGEVEEALNSGGTPPGPHRPGVCGENEVGIPNEVIAGLAPGASIDTVTCPGGPFPAGELQHDLQVGWNQNGGTIWVTWMDGSYLIPGGINVTVRRLGGTAPTPTPTPTPRPTVPPPPTGLPPGCEEGQYGIPYASIANLQVGQSVTVTSCSGGPFLADGLAEGIRVTYFTGGFPVTVTNNDHGHLIPGNHAMTVSRFAATSNPPPAPSPSPVPPVAPFPTGPLPTGHGKEQLQSAWDQQARNHNLYLPDLVERLTSLRTSTQELGQ